MLTTADIELKLKEIKPIINKKFFVDKIGYFGSYSRLEQHNLSDIDILVSFSKPLGWEFFDLKEYLEDQLKTKVDLVSEKALKKQLKKSILDSVIYV